MSSVWDETLSGFRSFVNDLKQNGAKDVVEYLFSLTTLTPWSKHRSSPNPSQRSMPDTLQEHSRRGSTALYDAVGITLANTEKEPHGADKIIAVIVTDGQENSSRERTKDNLHSAIDAKLKSGNWTFTYLGTQPETWDHAQNIGLLVPYVPTHRSRSVRPTSAAGKMTMQVLNAVTEF